MEDEKLLILMASKLTVIVQNAILESYLGTQSVGQFVDEGRGEEDDVPHTYASKMDMCQFLSMYVYRLCNILFMGLNVMHQRWTYVALTRCFPPFHKPISLLYE